MYRLFYSIKNTNTNFKQKTKTCNHEQQKILGKKKHPSKFSKHKEN